MKYLFILFTTLSLSLAAEESVIDFFEERLSLHPPTEQEELAVVQAVHLFLERIQQRNINDAYFLSTSKEFQQASSFKYFHLFIQDLYGKVLTTQLTRKNVSFTNVAKDQATYQILLKGSSTYQKFYLEFHLANREGDWKIMHIKIYESYPTTPSQQS
ncbi:hypothetical protein NEOC84_000017|uniref:hypothetical protein n=1 Tax=Neochlamydia sp. AcF84 TaxID=2315858 RepID=UPI0014082D2C|nr:hypothetical protein [Neochlamydia sp. AcF84]NGY94163.1 hypothetical protein [Neochlamydia sp. AcF84]